MLVHRFVSNNSIRQSFFLYFFFTFRGLSICLPCKLILHSRCTRYNAISSMFFLFIATIARFLDIFCCLRFFFVCFFFCACECRTNERARACLRSSLFCFAVALFEHRKKKRKSDRQGHPNNKIFNRCCCLDFNEEKKSKCRYN